MQTSSTSFQIAWTNHPSEFMHLCWVGEDLLAVSTSQGMGIYDLTGQQIARSAEPGLRLRWSPDTNFIRYLNREVKDWHWKTQLIEVFEECRLHPFDGAFDRQGNYFCCGESRNSDEGAGAAYDKNGEKLEQYDLLHRAKQLALSPDQSKIAFCLNHGSIPIYSFPSNQGRTEQNLQVSGTVMAAAWSASGRYLAVALVHGWMEVWDVDLAQKVGVFENIRNSGWNRLMNMQFVPGSDDLIIAGPSFRGDTFLFDWKKDNLLKVSYRAICFDISPSGETIAIGFYNGKVTVSSMAEYLVRKEEP